MRVRKSLHVESAGLVRKVPGGYQNGQNADGDPQRQYGGHNEFASHGASFSFAFPLAFQVEQIEQIPCQQGSRSHV